MEEISKKAKHVSNFLKGLANQSRLMILCELSEGEKSVTELIKATGIAQTSMSQHLSKLKSENIVNFRRQHRVLYYFIQHDAVSEIMAILYKNFCKENKK